MFPATLEFGREACFAPVPGVGVQRAFDVKQMLGHRVQSDDIKLTFEPAFVSFPDEDRLANEVTAVFQPFGCQLLEMVGHEIGLHGNLSKARVWGTTRIAFA